MITLSQKEAQTRIGADVFERRRFTQGEVGELISAAVTRDVRSAV